MACSPVLRGRLAGRVLVPVVLAFVAILAPEPAAQRPLPGTVDEGRNFDARITLSNALAPVAPSLVQSAAIDVLRAKLPDLDVTFDEGTGATRTMWNRVGYLTDGADGQAREIAEAYVAANVDLLGLTSADLADFEETDAVYTAVTGAWHFYFRQRLGGIPVYLGQLHVNVNRDGKILSVNNAFVPDLASVAPSLTPGIDAADAVGAIAAHLATAAPDLRVVTPESALPERETVLEAPSLSTEPMKARLMLLPVGRGVRLVWNTQVFTTDSQHGYDFTVDAVTGAVWTRFDWAASDQYRVYALPAESPSHVSPQPPSDGRTTLTNPHHNVASPFGWHDTNGVSGPETTYTAGNNAYAYTDFDADDLPDSFAGPVNCGFSLQCVFGIDLTRTPDWNWVSSVVNLFYVNNYIHDVQYQYGFDEAGGNFQWNNYGRGGTPGDYVQAEALDGSGVNNANFLTPPDGQRPRMQMYIWNAAAPSRDSSFDNGIIVHEYGHGISSRLVGGPSTTSCLNNQQQAGEGLSDWWALAYTATQGDTGARPRGMFTYLLNQPPTGAGARPQRYSTDPAVNTWTYASINGLSIPHGVGAVWAQGMWEAYWALVNQHGFSGNIYNATGTAGNLRAMLYVNEGLKNTACNPTFLNIRDGIIQAAVDSHGGQDVCRLWTSFAAFGMGSNAQSGGANSTTPVNGFNLPSACAATSPVPTGLKVARMSGNTVTLSWLPPAGPVTGYVLEGGTSPGQVLASIPTGSAAPSFTFGAPTGSFYVRIHALNGGARTGPSNEILMHVNTAVTPSAPVNLLGSVNGSTLGLAWMNTYGGAAPTSIILDVTGSLTTSLPMGVAESFSFSGVPGGTYTFRVRGANAAGAGAPSNPVTLAFPVGCSGVPQPPANFLTYKAGNTVFTEWDLPAAGPAPSGYVLNVSGAFNGSLPTGARALSGAVGPGTYSLSVAATNACGSSPATAVQTVTVP